MARPIELPNLDPLICADLFFSSQNRLLSQIRSQQAQILQLQSHQNQSSSAIAGDESPGVTTPGPGGQPIPTSSNPTSTAPNPSASGSLPRSPIFPRSSFDLARNDLRHRSRTPSRGASPRLRSTSISQDSGEPFALGGRDESAFYQAETQMLTRENQMLRHRIRDLGKSGGAARAGHGLKTGSTLT